MQVKRVLILVAVFQFWCAVAPYSYAGAKLSQYESKYYTIFTDAPQDTVREIDLRLTKMADLYAQRTRDFSGTIHQRMPFYLYEHDGDYLGTGAPANSGGYFDGQELVVRGGKLDNNTWHTLQHEGFHQFAHGTIAAHLPPWVDEGLAEYFGEAVFTGDSFIDGGIPQWRLKRIRDTLAKQAFLPLDRMMSLSLALWNQNLSVNNYDQGWSMVQFLAHGENGKYQGAFSTFMVNLSHGKSWQDAWLDTFGSADLFEPHWSDYWKGLPDDPTLEIYARAETLTLASLLGRAASQNQTFDSTNAFMAAVKSGKLNSDDLDWLPSSVRALAIYQMDELSKVHCSFALRPTKSPRLMQVECKLPDGSSILGSYSFNGKRIGEVTARTIGAKSHHSLAE